MNERKMYSEVIEIPNYGKIKIEELRLGDFNVVWHLLNRHESDPRDEYKTVTERLMKEIEMGFDVDNMFLLVAKKPDNWVVGLSNGCYDKTAGYLLHTVSLEPGRGIGQRLTSAKLDILFNHCGLEEVWAVPENDGGAKLIEKNDFEKTDKFLSLPPDVPVFEGTGWVLKKDRYKNLIESRGYVI